jgi:hypothetical protein
MRYEVQVLIVATAECLAFVPREQPSEGELGRCFLDFSCFICKLNDHPGWFLSLSCSSVNLMILLGFSTSCRGFSGVAPEPLSLGLRVIAIAWVKRREHRSQSLISH